LLDLEIENLSHLDDVLGEHDAVVVVLTQPSWCVPCQRLEKHLPDLEEKGHVVAVYNLDNVSDAAVGIERFEIRGIPRVTLFTNGTAHKELSGRTHIALDKEIKNVLGDSD
jgi:thiol-disulfide isomerase/thioredoxin